MIVPGSMGSEGDARVDGCALEDAAARTMRAALVLGHLDERLELLAAGSAVHLAEPRPDPNGAGGLSDG